MIRHFVHFTLNATAPAERGAVTAEIKNRLESLVGVVPGLRSMAVSSDLGLLDGHADVALVSDHDDVAALEGYQAHPAHVAAAAYIGSVIRAKSTVDIEL